MANTVNVLIRAKDEASKPISSITKLSVGLTAGFAAAGVASIKMAADFERGLDQVGAVAQATDGEMDQLRKTALKLGADTAFSAGEAAAAMEELAAGGRSVAQMVGGEAKAAVDLAAAGNYGLADSARTIATTMDIWKDTQLDTNEVVNRLAGAANSSRFGVEDMSGAIAQAGGVAAQMNVSFADMSTAVAATASSFASGSDAGTSFKTFLLGLDGTTDKAKDTIAKYGLEFRNATGELKPMSEIVDELAGKIGVLGEAEQVAALKTIFGNDAYRTAGGLMQMTGEEFTAMSEKMKNTDAAAVAAQRMGNLSGDIEALKGSVETLGIQVGSKAIPALRELAGGATAAVNAFGALPGESQQLILGVVGVTAAMPAMISGVTKGARAVKEMGGFMHTGKGQATGFALGIGAVTLATDLLLTKTTGHGVMEWIIGDPKRADAAAAALRTFNAEVDTLGAGVDKAALASGHLVKSQDEMVAGMKGSGIASQMATRNWEEHGKATSKAKGEVESYAKALAESATSMLPIIQDHDALSGELQEVFDKTVDYEARLKAYLGTMGEVTGEVMTATEKQALHTAAISATAVATPKAKGALDDYIASVAEAEDGTKDFVEALDIMIGRFADANPKVIALQGANAVLAEELADLKAKGDDVTASEAARIKTIEGLIEQNDAVIQGYKDNQDALEGQRGAITNLIGPTGYGGLLKAMDDAHLDQEAQIDVTGRVTKAYGNLANNDIPGAIGAFGEMKKTLDPQVWAVLAESVGPALNKAILDGSFTEDQRVAFRAKAEAMGISGVDGFVLGLSGGNAIARAKAAAAALAGASIDEFGVTIQAQSPSKVFHTFGTYITQGLVEGIDAGSADVAAAGIGVANDIINGMRGGFEAGWPAAAASFTTAMAADEFISAFADAGEKTVGAFLDALAKPGEGTAGRLYDVVQDLIETATEEGVPDAAGLGTQLVQALALAMTDGSDEAVQAALDLIGQIAGAIDTAIIANVPTLGESFAGTFADAVAHNDLVDQFGSAGASLIEQLTKGIADADPKVLGQAGVTAAGIVDTIKDKLDPAAASSLIGPFMEAIQRVIAGEGQAALDDLNEILAQIGSATGTGGAGGGGKKAAPTPGSAQAATGAFVAKQGPLATETSLSVSELVHIANVFGVEFEALMEMSRATVREHYQALANPGEWFNQNIQGVLGNYKRGTNYVPRDMLALIHKGEAVIPAELNWPGLLSSLASPVSRGISAPAATSITINLPNYLGSRADVAREILLELRRAGVNI